MVLRRGEGSKMKWGQLLVPSVAGVGVCCCVVYCLRCCRLLVLLRLVGVRQGRGEKKCCWCFVLM